MSRPSLSAFRALSTANRNGRKIFIFADPQTVVQAGKTISLYSNNYLHIEFSAANFTPQGKMNPCTMIEGMKARVVYAEVSDKLIAGQILSVELTK